jgi:hypothetical protein
MDALPTHALAHAVWAAPATITVLQPQQLSDLTIAAPEISDALVFASNPQALTFCIWIEVIAALGFAAAVPTAIAVNIHSIKATVSIFFICYTPT